MSQARGVESTGALVFPLAEAPPAPALVGQKASRLGALVRLGVPVPHGFVLTTEAFARWRSAGSLDVALTDCIARSLADLEARTSLRLGSAERPLLVSVRSGAASSMPGMMSTLLNVGISSEMTGAWLGASDALVGVHCETYARLLADCLAGASENANALTERVDAPELRGGDPRRRLGLLRELAREALFPDAPAEQVLRSVELVFRSWDSPGAIAHRAANRIPDDAGTAVIVQAMVLGHRDARSATALVSTRDPGTGAKRLEGRYLLGRQGADLVGPDGPATELPIEDLARDIPEASEALARYAERIERHFRWPQDLEITIESGRIHFLQARPAPLSPRAVLTVALDMVEEGILGADQAAGQMTPGVMAAVAQRAFAPDALARAEREGRILARGLTAGPGIATGPLVLASTPGGSTSGIVVREKIDPVEDVALMRSAAGLVSARGGTASHAATLARLLGKPYVTGCSDVTLETGGRRARFGETWVDEGAMVSLDADGGKLFAGELPTEQQAEPPELLRARDWLKTHGSVSPWQSVCDLDREREAVRPNHRENIRRILTTAPWRTPKAVVVELLKQLVPEEVRISQHVVAARDKERLRALMLEGLERGCWIGLRPCYAKKTFGKGTFQMAIQTPEQVDGFLQNADFQGPLRSGGWPSWSENDALEEIIVVWDPPGKGLKELEPRSFAFSVSCLPGVARVELVIGTMQMRYLEGAASEHLIHLTMTPGNGSRTVRFGRAHLREGDRVDPTAELVARAVEQAVFDRWWRPPFELPHAMLALDQEYGLQSLEFQGRTSGDRSAIEYMVLFDVKGAEEKHFLAPNTGGA